MATSNQLDAVAIETPIGRAITIERIVARRPRGRVRRKRWWIAAAVLVAGGIGAWCL